MSSFFVIPRRLDDLGSTTRRFLPPDSPHHALRGTARLSFTARIEGAHSDRAASASKKDGLAAPLPPSPFSSLLSRGWPEVPFDCAHRTSTFLVCAFCEQEGHSGYPSYSPCAANLNVRAIDVAGLIAEEIANGCHRVVDSADVAGWDAFGHAGQLFRRRAAGVDEAG